MALLNLDTNPADLLRALLKARDLMIANTVSTDLTGSLDKLIDRVIQYMDDERYREGAVEDARKVASVFLACAGEEPRKALGVPPPDPELQARLREPGTPWAHETADKLNQVELIVDDDAALGSGGSGMWVSSWIFLPVAFNESDEVLRDE
jgi:hypothetical protein